MRPTLLYITNLSYQAKGRVYYEEDLFITAQLRDAFQIALCHPQDTAAFEAAADVIVFRNTGPVLEYREAYLAFRQRLAGSGAKVFNDLNGKADMRGKQYLVDLTRAGLPVIPSVDCRDDLDRLPAAVTYVVKDKDGADSIGMAFVSPAELVQVAFDNTLAQPKIDFQYEVSFYFINQAFQYAAYAPDPAQRWRMVTYPATPSDIAWARQFIDWNTITHGIQRVDACRTQSGELLLVELEDLNPYLSLLDVTADLRDAFIANLKAALTRLLTA
nr:hypothetical protein [Herpetosiphon llansteffanensis]